MYTFVNQCRYRPGVAQRVPVSHDNGTGWWLGCQPYAPAAFTPRKYNVYINTEKANMRGNERKRIFTSEYYPWVV